MLAKILKGKGVNNIAITYVNNDYGKGFAEALDAAFKKEGGTVAAKEAHEDGKADYRAELGSLASSGADMLVVLAYADGSGQTIIRQALEGGDFSKFAGGDGMIGDSPGHGHRRRQARRLRRHQDRPLGNPGHGEVRRTGQGRRARPDRDVRAAGL